MNIWIGEEHSVCVCVCKEGEGQKYRSDQHLASPKHSWTHEFVLGNVWGDAHRRSF